jgi:hypothetical protein
MKSQYWMRLAIVLWAVLLAVACVRPLFKPTSSTVYPIYAHAGEDFAAGKNLYLEPHPGSDFFRYSPLVAAAFEPCGRLPLGLGGSLWRILGATIFLTGLAAWSRRAAPDVSLAGLFLLALPLSVGSIFNGQANVHMLGLMLWTAVLAARGRWTGAAACIAAAALFKGYPLAFGMLLALAAPIRLGVPLAAAIAGGFALPYLLQSPDYISEQYRSWIAAISHDDRTTFPLHGGYQDFHMLLRVLGINLSLDEYRMVQAGTGAAAAGAILCQLRKGVPPDRVAGNCFTLGICWMVVFGPSIESSTFILLSTILAREVLKPGVLRPLAILGAGLFFTSVILFAFPHQIHRPIVALGIQPLAALLVAVAAVGRVLTSQLEHPAVAIPEETVLRRAA